jgi:hypothetical protein
MFIPYKTKEENTVHSQSRCALRRRYAAARWLRAVTRLVVSIEVAVEV